MKILIAYDGSAQADTALADLSTAGLPEIADALVLSVAEPWAQHFGAFSDPMSGGLVPVVKEDANAFDNFARTAASDYCKRAIETLQEFFPRWKLTGLTAEGSPAVEILAEAESWMPDLIVLGSHGRAVLGRMILGSVSQRVLHHAKASVRIAHGKSGSHPRAPRILVGFDGSPDAERVVDVIASRRWPRGTLIRLVSVLDYRIVEGIPEAGISLLSQGRLRVVHSDWIQGKMTVASRKLGAKGLRVEKTEVEGEPRRMLLKQAGEWRADCIFAGSRGLSVMERFLVGSVSSGIAAKAECTVEIVRRARVGKAGLAVKSDLLSKLKTKRAVK